MSSKRSVALVSVYAVILLAIVSCSYLLEPADDHEQDPDLIGTWYLVANESLDQNQRYNRDIDPKYNITVKDEIGNVFTAESQGIEFCGVRMDGLIMFEYRFGEDTWIRGNGSIVNGLLVMYETHYYNDDNWFVSMSKYSKNPERLGVSLSPSPDVQRKWDLRDGQSHYYLSGSPEGYDLQGRRFFISGMWGDIFRAEMQQQVAVPVTTENPTGIEVTTRLMNGIFVSEHDGIRTAFMLDSSGKMWTLTIQDGLAVLRAIVISDSISTMVVTQRIYFDGIPPAIPDAPDMEGTWTSDGSSSVYGDGTTATAAGNIVIEYKWQEEYLFTGTIDFPPTMTPSGTLPAAGYVAYDQTAYNGWLIRLGTDLGSSEFKEGYGFLSADGSSMTAVGFIYDPADGKNGVVFYEFVKS